ncbi:hypothetical protein PPN31114_04692 [Pandoraea pneumonica]|jgi:hypothetical protein|uniref:DUF4148 domain-containing protein n=1 Tax=Pandoraea pneumonica TaxID=2508299 RepID=A0A5E4YQ96_9BURK|nr:DUF4148 domain-containing protein [Pandoraea pneumonica]VVE50999.1 hypothetical protein PPN31114_04692 [Pandoraea pneumonica]
MTRTLSHLLIAATLTVAAAPAAFAGTGGNGYPNENLFWQSSVYSEKLAVPSAQVRQELIEAQAQGKLTQTDSQYPQLATYGHPVGARVQGSTELINSTYAGS